MSRTHHKGRPLQEDSSRLVAAVKLIGATAAAVAAVIGVVSYFLPSPAETRTERSRIHRAMANGASAAISSVDLMWPATFPGYLARLRQQRDSARGISLSTPRRPQRMIDAGAASYPPARFTQVRARNSDDGLDTGGSGD